MLKAVGVMGCIPLVTPFQIFLGEQLREGEAFVTLKLSAQRSTPDRVAESKCR